MADSSIYARSDVSRDILQNSDYFTSVPKAVNEYVWNSIDNCKSNKSVTVRVAKQVGRIKIRRRGILKYNGIVIEEVKNGGGMSRDDLQNFFTMHGETLARKEGRRVRGRFGTGKAAAFGVAMDLILDTTKSGRRNVVRLQREALEPGLDKVPVEPLLTDQPVSSPDGTLVVIGRLKLKRVKMESVRKFLRRSIGLQLRNHEVYVEGERLVYSQPEQERQWVFDSSAELHDSVGSVTLTIRLSKKELEQEEMGIAILSSGYPMEFYDSPKAGDWTPRIFGTVDVPLLDSQDQIPIIDNTRSRLNRDNERVGTLLQWIDQSVSLVVSELERETRAKIDSEEMERLKKTATELEDLLNEDFSEVLAELESRPQIGGVGSLESGVQERSSGILTLVKDNSGETKIQLDEKGNVVILEPHGGSGHASSSVPDEPSRGTTSQEGIKAREEDTSGEKRKHRGGFRIEYVKEGAEAFRARWVREKMLINLNLDYPELALFKENREDPRFKALSGEIAISEYAIATVNLEVENGYVDVSNTANDALIEYRRIINRLGKKIAPLMTRWFGEHPGDS
jgi:hypothetical protein